MNNILQFLQTVSDPRATVMQMAQNIQNPMIRNMIDMANKGDEKGVRDCARNYYKENGRDFDTEINDISKYLKF